MVRVGLLHMVRVIHGTKCPVTDFLGVLCATIGVSCLTNVTTMWSQTFFVSLLSSIYIQYYDHWCLMLRLTMFFDHNFALICRISLQFAQNYINIDID